ncbi:MAG: hypothetical protein QM655_15775 [Nocardioidaceae bacterium]
MGGIGRDHSPLAGALLVAGVLAVIAGMRPAPPAAATPGRSARRLRLGRRARLMLLAGVGVGLAGWVVAGWALALVLGPVAVVGLPVLLSGWPSATDRAAGGDGGVDPVPAVS